MLTNEEKGERKRQRMIDKAKEFTLGTYSRKVAAVFQQMIRAEAAAQPEGAVPAVVDGQVTEVFRRVGQCVCVTCGRVQSWKGGVARYGGMHTGHFLGSRCNSILFEEANVAPQCVECNIFQGGAPQDFRLWMLSTTGKGTIERLERLKQQTVSFTREQLVDMKLEFYARLKAAEQRMKGPAPSRRIGY